MSAFLKVVVAALLAALAYCVAVIAALTLVGQICLHLGVKWTTAGTVLTIAWGVVRIGVFFPMGMAIGRTIAVRPVFGVSGTCSRNEQAYRRAGISGKCG